MLLTGKVVHWFSVDGIGRINIIPILFHIISIHHKTAVHHRIRIKDIQAGEKEIHTKQTEITNQVTCEGVLRGGNQIDPIGTILDDVPNQRVSPAGIKSKTHPILYQCVLLEHIQV